MHHKTAWIIDVFFKSIFSVDYNDMKFKKCFFVKVRACFGCEFFVDGEKRENRLYIFVT